MKNNTRNNAPLVSKNGHFRKLLSYRKAESIYSITCYFCKISLRYSNYTDGQMIEAALAGRQNIREGFTASATSREKELNGILAARKNLRDLLTVYEEFLDSRGQFHEGTDSPELVRMRESRLYCNPTSYFRLLIKTLPPENIARMAICMIRQTDYLLLKQMQSLTFEPMGFVS